MVPNKAYRGCCSEKIEIDSFLRNSHLYPVYDNGL